MNGLKHNVCPDNCVSTIDFLHHYLAGFLSSPMFMKLLTAKKSSMVSYVCIRQIRTNIISFVQLLVYNWFLILSCLDNIDIPFHK